MDHMMNKNLQNFQFIIEKILPRFSEKNQRDWSMAIFLTKDTKLEINVIASSIIGIKFLFFTKF